MPDWTAIVCIDWGKRPKCRYPVPFRSDRSSWFASSHRCAQCDVDVLRRVFLHAGNDMRVPVEVMPIVECPSRSLTILGWISCPRRCVA